MTNIAFAAAISTTAGATVMAGAGLTGDTTVTIKEAVGVAMTALLVMSWMDHKFEELKAADKKNKNRADQRMLWVSSMIRTICHKLKIDVLPMTPDGEPKSDA